MTAGTVNLRHIKNTMRDDLCDILGYKATKKGSSAYDTYLVEANATLKETKKDPLTYVKIKDAAVEVGKREGLRYYDESSRDWVAVHSELLERARQTILKTPDRPRLKGFRKLMVDEQWPVGFVKYIFDRSQSTDDGDYFAHMFLPEAKLYHRLIERYVVLPDEKRIALATLKAIDTYRHISDRARNSALPKNPLTETARREYFAAQANPLPPKVYSTASSLTSQGAGAGSSAGRGEGASVPTGRGRGTSARDNRGRGASSSTGRGGGANLPGTGSGGINSPAAQRSAASSPATRGSTADSSSPSAASSSPLRSPVNARRADNTSNDPVSPSGSNASSSRYTQASRSNTQSTNRSTRGKSSN